MTTEELKKALLTFIMEMYERGFNDSYTMIKDGMRLWPYKKECCCKLEEVVIGAMEAANKEKVSIEDLSKLADGMLSKFVENIN